ncbi:MAG: sensor histidine kinase [Candidatus Competibacteraceae bacterium]|nr:sensor histidine kinase [Candidatus Competibacteraceae bacterium]
MPDFCTNHAVFATVLIAELLACILVLAAAESRQDFWVELGLVSLFMQAVALSTAAILCVFRFLLVRLKAHATIWVAYGTSQLLTVLFYLLAVWIIEPISVMSIFDEPNHINTILRNFAISSIVSLAALRYFTFGNNGDKYGAEAHARVQALQARIRPHFLFNSLNTVASLTRTDTEKAEQAILDLADLFRFSLDTKDKISLKEELEITRQYLHIETLRLGDRLGVDWRLADSLPLTMLVPALILQPLVENAVYHGIEPRTDGGRIVISIEKCKDMLQFKIVNPLPSPGQVRRSSGHHIAQDNVRQRLTLAYGEANRMRIQQHDDQYQVAFTIPVSSINESADCR